MCLELCDCFTCTEKRGQEPGRGSAGHHSGPKTDYSDLIDLFSVKHF